MILFNGQNSANKASNMASIPPCHKYCMGDGLNLPEQSYYTNGLAMHHVPFLLKGQ